MRMNSGKHQRGKNSPDTSVSRASPRPQTVFCEDGAKEAGDTTRLRSGGFFHPSHHIPAPTVVFRTLPPSSSLARSWRGAGVPPATSSAGIRCWRSTDQANPTKATSSPAGCSLARLGGDEDSEARSQAPDLLRAMESRATCPSRSGAAEAFGSGSVILKGFGLQGSSSQDCSESGFLPFN